MYNYAETPPAITTNVLPCSLQIVSARNPIEGLGLMEALPTLFLATGTTFLFMRGYERARELLFPGTLMSWQFHWIFISLTTILSGIVTLLTMNRIVVHRQRTLNLRAGRKNSKRSTR